MATGQFSSSCFNWISCLVCEGQQSRHDDLVSGLKNWRSLVDWAKLVAKLKALMVQKTSISAVSKAGIVGRDFTKKIALLAMRSRGEETYPFAIKLR